MSQSPHPKQPSQRPRKTAIFLATLIVLRIIGVRAAGSGTLDQVSGWYPMGTHLTIHATPAYNSVFSNWQGTTNGATLVGPQITLIVNSSLSVTGIFLAKPPTNSGGVLIRKLTVNKTAVTLNAANGTSSGGWVLLSSTNLLLPWNQWPTNQTGTFDANGEVSANCFKNESDPAVFYLLRETP